MRATLYRYWLYFVAVILWVAGLEVVADRPMAWTWRGAIGALLIYAGAQCYVEYRWRVEGHRAMRGDYL